MSAPLVFRRFAHQIPAYRKLIIDSIIRVDHAGELAADQIYAGQLAVFPKDHKMEPVIREMWKEEQNHLDEMERLIGKYDVQPTIFAPLCSLAGFALGAGTALMGEKAAMACTIAVEEVIGQHYNDQISRLIEDSPEANKDLLALLSRLRDEEMEHHDKGIQYDGMDAPFYDTLKWVIQTGCKAAIYVTERV